MAHKNIQEVTDIYQETSKMVRFRLNKGWDYVWVTYHEERGFISITSSFGNYAYIWNAMGKGVNLTEFFSRAEPDYLAEKLFAAAQKEKNVFHFDLAIKELKTKALRERKSGELSKDEARAILNELSEWADFADSDLSEESFLREFCDRETLIEWDPEPYLSSPGRKLSGSYLVIRDEVIPLLQEYFRGEYSKGTDAGASAPA